jgi:hypothetical protein
VHHSDRGSIPIDLSLTYTDRLAELGIAPSVGSHGDSYDNNLAEAVNAAYKTELINRVKPWRCTDDIALATAEWVSWYNEERLHEALGYQTQPSTRPFRPAPYTPRASQPGFSTLTGQSARSPSCGPPFAGAVESYPAGRVVSIAEPAADPFDLFDEAVVALGTGVGDSGVDERVDLGPPLVDGCGQGEQFGDLGVAAPGQEPVQPMPGEVWVAADAHGGQQGAQFFFGDPRGQDLATAVFGHYGVPRLREAGVGQAFPRAEQSASVGPFGVDAAAAAIAQVPGDAAAHLVSASLASLTRWRWSTTTVALGSRPGVRIAEA